MNDADTFNGLFAPELAPIVQSTAQDPWKVLLVDDEPDIHAVLRLALQDVIVDGRALRLLDVASTEQAKVVLTGNPDIALVLLDVVMETEHAGLDLVEHIRKELGNHELQIILVTGQPGYAPARSVISDYAINGYQMKSELTTDKIFVCVCAALRTHTALFELERQRQQLVAQSESLRNSKDRLDSMTSAVPGVVYQFVQVPQGEWKFSYISGGVEHLYEMTAEAAYMDYKVLTDCMLAEDRQSHRESLERSASNLTPWIHEHRIKTPSGHLKWIRGEATPERQEDGSVVWNGILTDITRQKQLEQKLKTSQERLEMALSGGDIGFWDWHIPSNSVLYSKRWYAMLGLPEGDGTLDLATWTTLIHPDDLVKVNAALASHLEGKAPVYECEHRVRHADGRWLWLFDRGKVVERDNAGAPVRAVGSYIEITDRKRMEEQVRELAFYDTLTNLPNRRLLHDRLSQAMAATKRNGCYGALMFLDLDNFKPLNDSHGHEAGDLLLIEVANRLKGCVREMDTIARIGGDEFVVIISELVADRADSTSQARSVAEKIRTSLSQPYRLTDSREGIVQASYSHQLTASLGVALFISDEVSPEELLNLADRAMYLAKQAGRNSIRFHE